MSTGWLFDNEDTGREFSEAHPIRSGEVPDAKNVVPATCKNLLRELLDAWKAAEDDRVEIARLREAMAHRSPPVRPQVEDEAEILRRLSGGDTIVFSMDGDMAWFTKGDRAFVGDAIMSLREKGYLLRKHDVVDDEDDPRGIAYYDTISDAGRAHLLPKTDSTR